MKKILLLNLCMFCFALNVFADPAITATKGANGPAAEDLNGDDQVNVQDVILCTNIILETASGNGDINNDGQTDVQDVMAIVNEVLDNGSNEPESYLNGSIVEIMGAGFGSHDLDIEWLGGVDGNIESGSGLFKKAKWTADIQSTTRQASEYSTERSHSGSQSILSSLPIQTQYTSGFIYNNGVRFNSIYVSYWVFFDHVDSQGQWKQWRLRPSSGYSDIDGEIMESHWYEDVGSNFQNYTMIHCSQSSYAQCYPDGKDDHYQSDEDLLPPGKWVRREIYAIGSSADGVRDGSLFTSLHKQDAVPYVVRDHDGTIITRLSGSEKWQYFVFENYWGNIGSMGINKVESTTVCTDTTKNLVVDSYVGGIIKNVTDDSTGTIISNTDTTITVSLMSGGADNTFEVGDEYKIKTVDAGTKEKIYIDDIYIQIGGRSRVEIGNKMIWEDCTHREIQPPSAWADGSIQIELNKGSFQAGETVYLFVVGEDGKASEGFAVKIGGTP